MAKRTTLLIGIAECVTGLATPVHQVLNGQNARLSELCCAHVNDHLPLKGATAWDIGSDYGLTLTELYTHGVSNGRGVEIDRRGQQVAALWWAAGPLVFWHYLNRDAMTAGLYSPQEMMLAMTRREKAIKRVHRCYGGRPPQMDVLCGDIFDVLMAAGDEPKKFERDALVGCMILHHLLDKVSFPVLLQRMAKLVRVGGVLGFGLNSSLVTLTDKARDARLWKRCYRNEPFYLRARANLTALFEGREISPNPKPAPLCKDVVVEPGVTEEQIRAGTPDLEFLDMREQDFTHSAGIDLGTRCMLAHSMSGPPEFVKADMVQRAYAAARAQSTSKECYAFGRETLFTFAYRRIA